MQELKTDNVLIMVIGESVVITHIKTGVQTFVSTKKLDRWAMSQVRAELKPQQ